MKDALPSSRISQGRETRRILVQSRLKDPHKPLELDRKGKTGKQLNPFCHRLKALSFGECSRPRLLPLTRNGALGIDVLGLPLVVARVLTFALLLLLLLFLSRRNHSQ